MDDFKAQPFGKFFLLNKIAQGGMAEIFVAIDTTLPLESEKIVIKKLLPKYSGDRRFVPMLIDEAKITSLLEHPQIVTIFDVGAIGEDFYISLEYVNGRSLDLLIDKIKSQASKIPLSIISCIVYKISLALNYAHNFKDADGRGFNLVHRDVTPGNILLSYEGDIKLADFGIAIASRSSTFQRGEPAFGKKFYMPPEQFKNLSVDSKADIYSLGAVTYEMLTGRKAFEAKNEIELQNKIINDKPLPPSLTNSDIKAVDEIILKALSKNPYERYKTALEFSLELKKAIPSQNDETKNLKKFLENLFEEERIRDDKIINESILSFNNYRRTVESDKAGNLKIEWGSSSSEATEFIPQDYRESQTSFIPKKRPIEIQNSLDGKEDSKESPLKIKIKTKKVTEDELKDIKKVQSDEMLKHRELNPEITLSPIYPDEIIKIESSIKTGASKESSNKDILRTGEKKDQKVESPLVKKPVDFPSEQAKLQIKEEPPKEQPPVKIPDVTYEGAKVYKGYPLARKTLKDEKNKTQLLAKLPKYLIVTLVLVFSSLLIFKYLLNLQDQTQKFPKMNEFNPQSISIIIFSMEPTNEEKKIFQRILNIRDDPKYNSINSIKRFLQREYKRYKDKKMDFLNLSIIGPVTIEDKPPVKTEFLNKTKILDYFQNKIFEKKITVDNSSIKVHTFLYSKKPEEPPKYPIIYRGFLSSKSQIFFFPLLKEEINSSIILLANRILAAFGATDKLDSTGRPIYPDGLAELNLNPLYPQRLAEIMARYIPESPDSVRIAKSLEDMKIGPKTAMEIGWINEEEYKKFLQGK